MESNPDLTPMTYLADFFTVKETQHIPYINGLNNNKLSYSCIPLSKCIDQVSSDLSPRISLPSATIINEVSPEFFVSTDKIQLTAILKALLNALLTNEHLYDIVISAKEIGSITIIHIKTNTENYNAVVAGSLQTIEPLATTLGGCVTISNNKMYGLTVAVTFINH